MKLTSLQGEVSSSSYRQPYRSKVPRGFSQILAPRWIGWNASNVMYVASGRQISGMLTCYKNTNTNDTTGRKEWMFSFDHFNGIHSNLVRDEAWGTLTQGFNTLRYWVDYCKVSHRFRNSSNRAVNITLYNITPRKDMLSQVTVSGVVQQGQSPIQDWALGYKEMQEVIEPHLPGAAGDYTDWSEVPGTTPFKSGRFMSNWRVTAKSSFTLQPGKEHVHVTFLSPKFPFNVLDNAADKLNMGDIRRGVSHGLMFTTRGSIVSDSADGNVTTSKGFVQYTVSGSCRFRAIGKNRTLYTSFGGLDTNVTNANEEQMDDELHRDMQYGDVATLNPVAPV